MSPKNNTWETNGPRTSCSNSCQINLFNWNGFLDSINKVFTTQMKNAQENAPTMYQIEKHVLSHSNDDNL